MDDPILEANNGDLPNWVAFHNQASFVGTQNLPTNDLIASPTDGATIIFIVTASSETGQAEGTFNWKIKYNYPPELNPIADKTTTAYDASELASITVTD